MVDLTTRVQEFVNVDGWREAAARGCDLAEVKADGWWCRLAVRSRVAHGYTRQGEHRYEVPVDLPDCVLIGEYLFGTNRAEQGVDGAKGDFVAWDCLFMGGDCIHQLPYDERRAAVRTMLSYYHGSPWVRLNATYPIAKSDELWEQFVMKGGSEGMVYKNSTDPYVGSVVYRQKRVYDMDYIILGMVEGKGKNAGMMGALIGGQMIRGKVVERCNIGGGFYDSERIHIWKNPEQYVGRVLECHGWQVFPSGAMRHPNASRGADGALLWRSDKTPADCRWPRRVT